MKPLSVYDGVTQRRLAFLENAYDISYKQQLNAVWTGSFKLPYFDPKKQYCLPLNLIEIWDVDGSGDDKHIGLFKIISIKEDLNGDSSDVIEYTLEHVFNSLINSYILGFKDFGGYGNETTGEIISAILEHQDEENWILGECDYDDIFKYEFENSNLLNALYTVSDRLIENYYWSFNTQNFPWEVNLKKVLEDPVTDIRYGKNIFGMSREIDPRSLCTRLYIYGKTQEDGSYLTVTSLNDGKEYLDSEEGIATYGIITMIVHEEYFETEQSLYDYGISLLQKLDTPFITYKFDIKTINNAANLKLGDTVRVVTEDGLDTNLVIQEIDKDDISRSPNEGKIVVGQGTVELGIIIKQFI